MKVGVILPLGDRDELRRPFTFPKFGSSRLRRKQAVSIQFGFTTTCSTSFRSGTSGSSRRLDDLVRAQQAQLNGSSLAPSCSAPHSGTPRYSAKMAVTLDDVSGGRIILGLGAGWHKPEFDAFGLNFNHRVDQFEEALEIIVPLVKKGEVDFTGKYSSAPNCQMLPRPSREIPVLIAGVKPRMLQLTAKFADSWNTAWHGDVSGIAGRRASLEAACAAVGRDPSTLAVTAGLMSGFLSSVKCRNTKPAILDGRSSCSCRWTQRLCRRRCEPRDCVALSVERRLDRPARGVREDLKIIRGKVGRKSPTLVCFPEIRSSECAQLAGNNGGSGRGAGGD